MQGAVLLSEAAPLNPGIQTGLLLPFLEHSWVIPGAQMRAVLCMVQEHGAGEEKS